MHVKEQKNNCNNRTLNHNSDTTNTIILLMGLTLRLACFLTFKTIKIRNSVYLTRSFNIKKRINQPCD
ncbi:hypothetical protein HLPCO_002117 [Haloplasma contractile SSD-17B]|uniref:Uncharacterized protein n=1 Tax=Haloplasma contractile SSD-17B TaxID=1033810 RepID=U2DTT9_9MOLU|nr:hypothetical protein HLPCO_002117 [Haloplasma contractile SSD-17B]